MSDGPKVKPECQNCGSDHIERCCYMGWDNDKQEWKTYDLYLLCCSCESGPIEFVPLSVADYARIAIKNAESE